MSTTHRPLPAALLRSLAASSLREAARREAAEAAPHHQRWITRCPHHYAPSRCPWARSLNDGSGRRRCGDRSDWVNIPVDR